MLLNVSNKGVPCMVKFSNMLLGPGVECCSHWTVPQDCKLHQDNVFISLPLLNDMMMRMKAVGKRGKTFSLTFPSNQTVNSCSYPKDAPATTLSLQLQTWGSLLRQLSSDGTKLLCRWEKQHFTAHWVFQDIPWKGETKTWLYRAV